MERICFPRLSLSFPLLLLGVLTLPLLLDDRGEAGLDHSQAGSEPHPDSQGPAETGIPGRQEGRDEDSVPTQLSGIDTGRAFSPQCSERIETEFSRAAEIPGSSTPAGEPALHRPADARQASPASQSWKHHPVRGPPAA